MTRRPGSALAAFALLAASAPSPATAGDLVLGFGTNLLYDDNVYGRSSDEIDDFTLQFIPKVRYIDKAGRATFDVRYDPTYEYFFDESGLRGWGHSARAVAEWTPSPTTRVSFEDDLARYKGSRLLTTTDGTGTPIETAAQDPLLRNVAQLGVVHDISAITRMSVTAHAGVWEFEDDRRVDQQNYGVDLAFTRLVREGLRFGGSVSVTHAMYDDVAGRSSADTTYYSLALVAEWQASDRLSFDVSVGPAYVDSRSERVRPPPGAVVLGAIPDVDPGSSTTAFAAITARWALARGELSLGYERGEDFGSALGFSAVTDTIAARGRYEILKNLSLDGALLWERRKGDIEFVVFIPVIANLVVPQLIEGDEEIDSITASASLTYLIRPTTKLALTCSWRTQDERRSFVSDFRDVERLQVGLWFTQQFSAIRW
jgi:hypothetical protein